MFKKERSETFTVSNSFGHHYGTSKKFIHWKGYRVLCRVTYTSRFAKHGIEAYARGHMQKKLSKSGKPNLKKTRNVTLNGVPCTITVLQVKPYTDVINTEPRSHYSGYGSSRANNGYDEGDMMMAAGVGLMFGAGMF